MKVRIPQSEVGKYDPGSFDTRAGEPLSCEKMNGLAQAMLDLAERIKATGLTERTRKDDVNPLRLNVGYLVGWPGYRKATVSSWDGAAGDLLLRLGKVLNWCYSSSGGKHGPDEIVAELQTLGAYARKLAGAKTGLDEGSVNWTDLVRRLRTVADAFDGSPVSPGTIDLASIASWVAMDAYGALRWQPAEGKTVERETTEAEDEILGLLSGVRDLLKTIMDRRADPDAGRFLRGKADSIEELLRDGSVDAGGVQNKPMLAAGSKSPDPEDTPPGPNGSEKWSRPMPLTDLADRILKSPTKYRKLKSVYGKRLKKLGDKSWAIRYDGLPENIIREIERP